MVHVNAEKSDFMYNKFGCLKLIYIKRVLEQEKHDKQTTFPIFTSFSLFFFFFPS